MNLVLRLDDPRPKTLKVLVQTRFLLKCQWHFQSRSQWPTSNSRHTLTPRWTWYQDMMILGLKL